MPITLSRLCTARYAQADVAGTEPRTKALLNMSNTNETEILTVSPSGKFKSRSNPLCAVIATTETRSE